MNHSAGKVIQVVWLGRIAFDQAWQIQEQAAADIAANRRPPVLFLLEHFPVFTLGRKAALKNVLWDEKTLTEHGVDLRQVDRGGDVTYHGPGQLVGYPIIPLAGTGWAGDRIPQADFVGYVRKLETTIIKALARLGVVAGQRSGYTGVWVAADVASRCLRCDPARKPAPAKIASIGVKVDVNGISRHGFALNIETDPLYWEGIVACGIEDVWMVNLSDLVFPVPGLEQVKKAVIDAFEEVFNYRIEQMINK